MKKLFVVLIVVITMMLILSFAKDTIIKVSVEKGVELVTGLPLRTQSFKVGIVRQLVRVKNLRLFNPKGYKDRIMLDMPEIYVDYNLPAIIKGKVHLQEMRLNMKEFIVVKDEKGKLNLDSLKVVQAQKEGKKLGSEEKEKVPEIQIDNLELKIGKAVYKDYSRGGEPSIKEFEINLNERYKNIKNPYALVSLIVVKALKNTTIAGLTGFDLQGLQGTISDTLATAQKVAVKAVEKAQETVKETAETLKKTTETLTETLKFPFGSKEEK